uniref:VWFA domain-containing protein n=1 Tax=Steinernema glaseri TaxID=37863 RepID=A0A1I8APL4_9BILA
MEPQQNRTGDRWNVWRRVKDAWLDIVLIFDSTTGVGKDGFSGTKTMLWPYIHKLAISTGSGRHTTLALINLGSTAQVAASLDELSTTDKAYVT